MNDPVITQQPWPRRKLIRNGVTEKDVRDHLTGLGYAGHAARFDYLELFAVARPGWVQVFKFKVRVRNSTGEMTDLHGAVRDDERVDTKIYVAEKQQDRDSQAAMWARGLITAQREPLGKLQLALLGLFAVALSLALVGALVSSTT